MAEKREAFPGFPLLLKALIMSSSKKILTLTFSLLSSVAGSQTAPVTSLGIVTSATPGTVTIPVTVTGFIGVGQFTLTFTYNANCISYSGSTAHPAFTGLTVTNTVLSGQGKIVIAWPGVAANFTLPDLTHLADISFTYITSSTDLSWSYTFDICRYRKYSGGVYVNLPDSPKSIYYIHGGVGDRGAPVVTAPTISNVVTGSVSVPVTVTNFNSIEAFSLSLEYDQDVLTYVSCTPNPDLSGTFFAGSQMGPNGKMMVTPGWLGNKTLADGSTLFTVTFTYSGASKSYSTLNWMDNGPSCEYTATGNKLIDIPYANYYNNGLIFTQYAAKAALPSVMDAVPSGSLEIPVITEDFSGISSFTLTFEYDTAALIYNSFTPNPGLPALTVVNNAPVGSKRKLAVAWTGSSPQSLPDSSSVVTLGFTVKNAPTNLSWVTSDATSCRFNDNLGHALCDLPKSAFYTNGMVASQLAPQTIAWYASPAPGQQVTLPVLAYRFSDIGYFTLALDYDPGVMTYQSASLAAALGGTFSATSPNAGRIIMTWSGTASSLPDSSNLVNLVFNYINGNTPLAWYDNGNSCKFAASATDSALYDNPKSHCYINGYIGPTPLVTNFVASNVNPGTNATITLNDLTTGGPTGWFWSISPGTFSFVSSTSASSQNPQVQFLAPGAYTVSLVTSRGMAMGIKVKEDYIHAGIPGLWTGNSSSDWYNGLNWHNGQVPGSSIDVAIPASALNWPQLSGNMTLGTICSDLAIEGTAQMQVDGNFTINSGSSMTFTGAGKLRIGGDWLNQGTFDAGTGTVEFTGNDDASVLESDSPESFYKIILSKTNANLYIKGSVNVFGTEN